MSERICIVDTETTGLNKVNGVHHIAAYICHMDTTELKVVAVFNAHAKPFSTDVIDAKALSVSGVTVPQIMSYEDPRRVFEQFRKFLLDNSGGKMFFSGWNARFDEDMIRSFFDKNGQSKLFNALFWTPSYDVMVLTLDCLKSQRSFFQNFKLTTIAKKFNINQDKTHHDALVDVDSTAKILASIKGISFINLKKGR